MSNNIEYKKKVEIIFNIISKNFYFLLKYKFSLIKNILYCY